MDKELFLNNLETLVLNQENITPLFIFKRALPYTKIHRCIHLADVYSIVYAITEDTTFSKNVANLLKIFRVNNDIFRKYMLLAIQEAKNLA